MNNSYFRFNQTLLSKPILASDNMYHYIYKIHNTVNGKFYIGCHSTTKLDDGYCGSGKLLMKAFNKYGYENFVKIIVSFHKSKNDVEKKESEIITPILLADPQCYNLSPGGGHRPMKTVTCIDTVLNKNVRIPADEYYLNPDRYVSHTKGQIKVIDSEGNIFMCKINDPRLKTGEIKDYVKELIKDTLPCRIVKTGQNIRAHKDDPRLKTGEIIPSVKGMKKINKDGKIKFVNKNEINEYLNNGWKLGGGKMKRINIVKNNIIKTIDVCDKNMYFNDGWELVRTKKLKNTIGMNKGGKYKNIPKEEVESYMNNGWMIGRGKEKMIWMNKDGITKQVKLSEVDLYSAEGWVKGNKRKINKNRIGISKNGQKKYIDPEQLEIYISEGWVKGFK